MANKIIKAQMKQRRDTKANWATKNPVLLAGELGIVSDDPNLYKVGDGTTAWNALPFRGFDGTIAQETGTSLNTVMSQKAVTDQFTSQIFEKGNVSYGEDADNESLHRSVYIPCKKNDTIGGFILRVKIYDESFTYIGEEGTELSGTQYASYIVQNEKCAYVRLTVYTTQLGKSAITINGLNPLLLLDKSMIAEIKRLNKSDKDIMSKIENLNCVYETTPDVLKIPAIFGILDMAITPQDGYLYTVVLRNLANASQFSVYRALTSSPTTLQHCGNFVTTATTQREGIAKYEATFNTGEKGAVIIDWDRIKGLETGALYPNKYILKPEVFEGGLLSRKLIPQLNEVNETLTDVQNRLTGVESAIGNEASQPKETYWAACGDSITNANHATIYDIADGDPYMPIDGYANLNTYKRKNYAYYIAQRNRLKWANYGWGGTTLASVTSKAYGYKNAFVDERMQSLARVTWNYISLFFGGNDSYFGPTAWKDKWLKEKYGQDIGYPVNAEQIGTTGFATQAQKDACDAVTGTVNGVDYATNEEYFIAKFIGTVNDTSKDTWFGALNTAVSYLLSNHPKAKIILIASYTPSSPKYADAVIEVAKRWGVRYFDFREVPHWPVSARPNWRGLENPDTADGKWPLENGLMYGATVDGRNMSLYIYDGAHPTNRGYEEMSHLLESTVMD